MKTTFFKLLIRDKRSQISYIIYSDLVMNNRFLNLGNKGGPHPLSAKDLGDLQITSLLQVPRVLA